MQKEINLPASVPISVEGPNVPYFLVGDEAFPLTNYMLRPYPGKTLTPERKIYNYRLSRARRVIENTFGILAIQWRIFRRPINASMKTTEKIVQAAVCLHNFLKRKEYENELNICDDIDYELNEDSPKSWSFQEITKIGTNNSCRSAISVRDELCAYFNGEGAVPWQYENCNM